MVSHQPNQRRSWKAYRAWVCPECRANSDTAANCAVDIIEGWNGRRVLAHDLASPRAAIHPVPDPLAANAAGHLDPTTLAP